MPIQPRSKKQYKQSRLRVQAVHTKCPECLMVYNRAESADRILHDRHHELVMQGRPWSPNWGEAVQFDTPKSLSARDKIVVIRPSYPPEIRAALQILNLVNQELHAPEENEFWSNTESENGRAFIYVRDTRAVGVITVEILTPERGRWMIHDTRVIIDHVRPAFKLGISRIWVCKTQRHHGIATKLIDTARSNVIFGETIDKYSVAWSQPTDAGGKLAHSFNSVRHKSGKTLIPCYI